MVVSDKESNRRDRIGRCAMISVVDEEIMKSEDGQELVVPPTGEDHETYEQVHISRELTKEQMKCFLTFDFHITCFVCFVQFLPVRLPEAALTSYHSRISEISDVRPVLFVSTLRLQVLAVQTKPEVSFSIGGSSITVQVTV